MKCPCCGKKVSDNARFCPRCGNAVKGMTKESEESHKKYKRFIMITVISFILTLAVLGILCSWWKMKMSVYLDAAVNYEKVNQILMELAESGEYIEADTEKKAEQMLVLLDELEIEGQIASGSVSYDEIKKMVYFEYADGAYGGIMLEHFADGESGSLDSYAAEYDENGLLKNVKREVSFDFDGNPYENNLSALILYDLGPGCEDELKLLQEEQELWTDEYLNTELNESCTVSTFRRGLNNYNLVILQEHGMLYQNIPVIFLYEIPSFQTMNAKITGVIPEFIGEEKIYLDDLKEKRIGTILCEDMAFHYILLPDFFTYYYANIKLEDTIVWLGCCDGYRNDLLVKSFADCGAKAVLGCTETVKTRYNICMQDAFVYMLLYGNTVHDSLDFAKSVWGSNDSIFLENYFQMEDDTPSEIRYYNGGKEKLVTLTAAAEASLAENDDEDNAEENPGPWEHAEPEESYTGNFESIYQEFMKNKGYQSVLTEIGAQEEVGYAICDVNADKIKECIVEAKVLSEDYGASQIYDYYYIFYRYDAEKEQVVESGRIKNATYQGLFYTRELNMISCYTRTSSDYADHMYLYDGNTLIFQYDVGWWEDKSSAQYVTYYYVSYSDNGNDHMYSKDDVIAFYRYDDDSAAKIAKDEYQKYTGNLTEIEFKAVEQSEDEIVSKKSKSIPDDAEIFRGHRYKLYNIETIRTWEEAEAYCENLGGHLVTITSEEEQNSVYRYIEMFDVDADIWIGITDLDSEGDWSHWITGERVTYTNWGDGEPDDHGDGQDYGVICSGYRGGIDFSIEPGQWDDIDNDEDAVYGCFVCEWD